MRRLLSVLLLTSSLWAQRAGVIANSGVQGPGAGAPVGSINSGTVGDYSYYSGATTLDAAGILSRDGTNRRNVLTRADIQSLPIASPTTAITATLAGLGAGNVDSGAHNYVFAFVDSLGRITGYSPVSNTVTTTGGNGQVALTGIVVGGTGTVSRKVYRSSADDLSGEWSLLTTIANNTATTFADNLADSTLTDPAPYFNATGGNIYSGSNVVGLVSSSGLAAGNALGTELSSSGIQAQAVGGLFVNNAVTQYTNFSAQDYFGAYIKSAVTAVPGDMTDIGIFGLRSSVNVDGTGSNTTVVSGLDLITLSSMAGGLTSLLGTDINVLNLGSAVTNQIGADIVSTVISGSSTNNIGLRVQDITTGTNKFAIKTGLGKVSWGDAEISTGAAPTVTGCTAAAIVANSTMLAGQVNGTPTGACALTLTFATAAPHGWNCSISNMTTANIIRQTATTTTTAVFTGVTVANDVLSYGPCIGW